jgi:ribonucleoside-diphosphate reductase alpha chain
VDLLKTYKYGVKTLYYHTTRDGSGEEGMLEKEDDNNFIGTLLSSNSAGS